MTESRSLLGLASARLAEAGVPSPDNDAEILLAHVLGIPRGNLLLVDDVADGPANDFRALVSRRAERIPLQHLTGSTGFRYVDLAVGAGVFTPRPETELLAGWGIERAGEVVGRAPVVVDLCTGSGAIALSIADEVPSAQVHAVELDPDAFVWAQRNLAGSGIDLREGDMADAFVELDGTVDVVVCNPPYIPLTEYAGVAAEARDHDPALALWSGQDGLDAMRVLERVAARLLRPDGWVGAEHADLQGESAPGVFAAAGRWTDVRDHRDLAGRPRYLTARLAR
ncbi:MAG: peptide chain release factor N(5)-glutamine methyltransferase [Propionibacteriales bacterium]|nr:peptide chain release factor N(5)-glutamine methyltransferase [Propionibacteriales bacterium]